MDIHNQVALVTGAGSGLGAATALHLAELGAKVALLDLNLDAVQAVCGPLDGVAFECDVASAVSVEAVLAQVTQALGVPRICVNCAGIAPGRRTVGRDGPMPLEEFHRVIQVNLVGTFNVTRVCAAAMSGLEPVAGSESELAGERGVVVNTASVAAYEGQVGQAAYSASKAGVVGLTLPLAREFAQFGIRVMTIAPGLMDTAMMASFPEAVRASLGEQVPFPRRLGHPQEYAQLVAHIVQNPLLNGSVVRLDGAIRLAPR